MGENDVIPKPAPFTVMLNDPVPGTLVLGPTAVTTGASNDTLSVKLPACCPDVTDTRWVPPCPVGTRHRTDESDSQSVPSHAVDPSLPAKVPAKSPKLPPFTVTLVDPVPARFPECAVLNTGASNDNTSVMLPAIAPAVNATLLVLKLPAGTRHRTDESDSHSFPSHAVSPTRIAPDTPNWPKDLPATVTLVDPVPARFPECIVLNAGTSNDNPSVMLPASTPAVTTTLRVPPIPDPTRHRTDESESHSVPSHAVAPALPSWLYDTSPKPAPFIVTLIDPVPGLLLLAVTLTETRSYDHPSVNVEATTSAVTDT